METVELVIEIDEETYKDIKKGKVYSSIRDVPQESVLAIANGIPLPKRHGRLIDENTIAYTEEEFADGRTYMVVHPCDIEDAPTVIEADRDCQTCKNSKDGKCAGTEECHECMWDSQYKEVDNG